MTKSSETRRIRAKDREWKSNIDVFFDKSRPFVSKWWKFIKGKMKKAIKWYFCFQPKNDGQLALHLILWSLVTMGLVGWYNIAFGRGW
jgi:hypothetical protein